MSCKSDSKMRIDEHCEDHAITIVPVYPRKVLQASAKPDGCYVPQVQMVRCKELCSVKEFRESLVRGGVIPLSFVHREPKVYRNCRR